MADAPPIKGAPGGVTFVFLLPILFAVSPVSLPGLYR
jgi:hypothetical protein